jgi:tetratricopeptide (TPR) repeat protein
MDCRRILALALLGGVGGCTTHHATSVPAPPVIQSEPPPLAKKAPDGGAKRTPRPETCLAAGQFFAQQAEAEDKGTVIQEQLHEKARKAYQQALEIDPKYLPAHRALAQLYTVMEDHEHAVAAYQRALQAAPNEASLYYELGMCYARKKEWAPALDNLQKAVDRDPENRPYVNTLGHALARAGRYQESLAAFSRVHSPAMAHYQLARMLYHLQQPILGRRQLQLALNADPTLEPARKLLAEADGVAEPAVRQVGYQEAPPQASEMSPFQGRPMAVQVRSELDPAVARRLPPPPAAPREIQANVVDVSPLRESESPAIAKP